MTQIEKLLYVIKIHKVEDLYESKIRRKIRRVPKFDAQMVMTREREVVMMGSSFPASSQ